MPKKKQVFKSVGEKMKELQRVQELQKAKVEIRRSDSRFLKVSAELLPMLYKDSKDLGRQMAGLCEVVLRGVEPPMREYQFHPKKGYRFDLAWPSIKVAIEGEGGFFMDKGGHTSVTGMLRDVDKYNAAAMLGWVVLRVHAKMMKDGTYLTLTDYIHQRLIQAGKRV